MDGLLSHWCSQCNRAPHGGYYCGHHICTGGTCSSHCGTNRGKYRACMMGSRCVPDVVCTATCLWAKQYWHSSATRCFGTSCATSSTWPWCCKHFISYQKAVNYPAGLSNSLLLLILPHRWAEKFTPRFRRMRGDCRSLNARIAAHWIKSSSWCNSIASAQKECLNFGHKFQLWVCIQMNHGKSRRCSISFVRHWQVAGVVWVLLK